MKKNFFTIIQHELVKGSVYVLVGSLVASFLNYLFHVITGRMLGPGSYATIASLISLTYVVSFLLQIINTVTARKVAELSAINNIARIKGVMIQLLLRISLISAAVIVFFFFTKEMIADYLNIENSNYVVLIGTGVAIGLFTAIPSALLQGLTRFSSFAVLNILSALFKDIVTVIAIVLGFGIGGILTGLPAMGIIMFFVYFIPIKDVVRAKASTSRISLSSYTSTIWVAAAYLGLGFMINTDVIIVKHFFPSYDAGLYAALSNLGKIVLFATLPISLVLLPIASRRRKQGKSASKELGIALALIVGISLGIVFGYLLFPKLVISLFYGNQYHSISTYLWLIGVYFLFYNVSNVLVSYYISLHKKILLLTPLLFSLLQIALIYQYHNSFYSILYSMITSAVLLTGALLGYYIYYERKTKTI